MSGCCHEAHDQDHHDHSHDDPERGVAYSLYKYIETGKVVCLNESAVNSGVKVFKAWVDRTDVTEYVESDADEQLLFFIPFAGNVTLKSLIVRGEEGESHPKTLKLFANRDDIDFDNADKLIPLQTIELAQDRRGDIEYFTTLAKFQNLHNVTLYFSDNFGGQISKLFYIGLAGEHAEMKRDTIITVYETAPNPADHKKVHEAYGSSHSVS